MTCRFCGATLSRVACDLGCQPLANALVPMDAPAHPDPRYPLCVMVCDSCLLLQLAEIVDPAALFLDYSYVSAVSSVWRAHVEAFAVMAQARFALTPESLVIEVGSNDGSLLRSFLRCGVRCLGIDPAANIAAVARDSGIPTMTAFFGAEIARNLAAEGERADLLVANNVLAHAPALTDFVQGLATLLAPTGVLSIEVPHVLTMLRDGQFDTIYHEHVFYFSARTLQRILRSAGLEVFDVQTLPTHGGSLRILAQHATTGRYPSTTALKNILVAEEDAGLSDPQRYTSLAEAAARVTCDLRRFLTRAQAEGSCVAAYGAAAKGTMLLNCADVSAEQIDCIADASPLKQGQRIPGCRLPIVPPDHLRHLRPDYLLILPWNIADEIMAATAFIGEWGGRFVIPSPTLRVVPA